MSNKDDNESIKNNPPKPDLAKDANGGRDDEQPSFLAFLLIISIMFFLCWITCQFIFGDI